MFSGLELTPTENPQEYFEKSMTMRSLKLLIDGDEEGALEAKAPTSESHDEEPLDRALDFNQVFTKADSGPSNTSESCSTDAAPG